jgi:hypothetical protein
MKNQKEELLKLFQSQPNQWIPVYEVAKLALQYNTRIKELRAEGHDIENKTLEIVNGQRHTAFRYNPPCKGQYQERFHFINKL